ncbi:hypothetical protein [Streptomyces zaomyceticus]|uniref:hypothetical protein n=1 Tax=Streptomyces zaomyceticus TaxID=68286 RepID=UPI003415F7CA
MEQNLAERLGPDRETWVTPLPLAIWFHRWDERDHPSVALFARRRMAYWLPNTTSTDHEDVIGDILSKRVHPEWDSEHRCWTISDQHFQQLSEALFKDYPALSLGREYNEHEKCNWQCQNAASPLCTCSCQARNHAGGKWMAGWSVLDEDTSVVSRRNWSWMLIEKATRLAA